MIAVARSILVIIWHLLAAPTAAIRTLGDRLNIQCRTRSYVQQLRSLG